MKKIVVASMKKDQVPEALQPEWLADMKSLEAEFKKGREAFVRYTNGRLIITVRDKQK